MYIVPDEEMVMTPGGLRPKSQVHRVEREHHLSGAAGRIRTLNSDDELIADHGYVAKKPRGRPLMPRNVNAPKAKAAAAGAPLPAYGSGWITYTSWSNGTGTPVSRFSTEWVVPPAPTTQSGQVIFLFNGIQNSTMIYQPVLQWGVSAAGGGDYWAVASWYADGQGGVAFYSALTQVNPGDVLTGVMTLTGTSDEGLSYDSVFTGIANSDLTISDVEELTWCIETLEVYGITQPSDYPAINKTQMSAISVATGDTYPNVEWLITNAVTDCGQHTLLFDLDSSGSGEVDIWYSPSPFWTTGLSTIDAGTSQDWWFTFSGTGDIGPQLIQAQPLDASGELATVGIAESLDSNGNLAYHATVANNGADSVQFQWRGGGR